MDQDYPLGVMDTPVMLPDGMFSSSWISEETARERAAHAAATTGIVSAIRTPGVAELLTSVLGVDIAVSRTPFALRPGQRALALPITGHPLLKGLGAAQI